MLSSVTRTRAIPQLSKLSNSAFQAVRMLYSTTPSAKGALPSRKASAQEQEIISEILDNYSLKPSEKSYSHYAETAVFHDPVSIAKGKKSIMSQFNGMPKLFVLPILIVSHC